MIIAHGVEVLAVYNMSRKSKSDALFASSFKKYDVTLSDTLHYTK